RSECSSGLQTAMRLCGKGRQAVLKGSLKASNTLSESLSVSVSQSNYSHPPPPRSLGGIRCEGVNADSDSHLNKQPKRQSPLLFRFLEVQNQDSPDCFPAARALSISPKKAKHCSHL
ncbi:MAG: hypothetical protein ACOZBW_02635, partial [Thermodesulfobacteriota bacterium]